jgi:hypothetical protein
MQQMKWRRHRITRAMQSHAADGTAARVHSESAHAIS